MEGAKMNTHNPNVIRRIYGIDLEHTGNTTQPEKLIKKMTEFPDD